MTFVTAFLDLAALDYDELVAMKAAGEEIKRCEQALEDGELTIVGEMKRDQGEIPELEHYPDDDVQQGQSQFFYHWHADRGDVEIGHFHTFLRLEKNEATHVIAIAMSDESTPISLFCTNLWVTEEHMMPASVLAEQLHLFEITHAAPSWPVNRWVTAMLTLFRPQVSFLLHHRDERLNEVAEDSGRSMDEVKRDHAIEVTGLLAISIDEQIKAVKAALKKQDKAAKA
jgi:hypothetical protein